MLALLFIYFSHPVFAAESETLIPQVEFTGSATFESLNDDTYVPTTRLPLSSDRASSLDDLKWKSAYPLQNYGYPSGASGVSLGGRSIEDTQVTTMGVPLNLPQGGGADFSFFPDFLWKEVVLSPSTSSSGFSPAAASGRLEFIPWTRAKLLDPNGLKKPYRLTLAADRDLQSFSMASAQKDIAVVAGATSGLMQGEAGGFSYYLIRRPGSHLLLHALGSNQKGDSPGSFSYPSPLAKKSVWRVIPVLESHQEFDSGLIFESTLFADFQELKYTDPASSFGDSDTHTQQYGIENAFLMGSYTLALSGRYVRFQSDTFKELNEWPLYAALTRDLFSSIGVSTKITANANYLNKVGLYPGAKISAKFSEDAKIFPFAEISSIAKMPTLTARYYELGIYYHGNPNLKPERVDQILGGYQFESSGLKSTSTLKAEYRDSIQVTSGATTVNQGVAFLMSVHEELRLSLTDIFSLGSDTLLSGSRLKNSKFTYPDLPLLSQAASLGALLGEQTSLEARVKYMGPSTASGGAFHASYTLFGLSGSANLSSEWRLTLGVDNLFDQPAQAVLDYPLPGRMAFASIQASF